jgi:hypothetical protein
VSSKQPSQNQIPSTVAISKAHQKVPAHKKKAPTRNQRGAELHKTLQPTEAYLTTQKNGQEGEDWQDTIRQLKRGELQDPQFLIDFLQRDEYSFGTGYYKEKIWKYLKRAPLTAGQKEQLRKIALEYLSRPMRREFFPMCRFMYHIADDDLKAKVHQLSLPKAIPNRWLAHLLYAYLQSPEYGEEHRRVSPYRKL